MSLFGKRNSKFKEGHSEYPWSQRKLNDRKGKALPRHGHGCVARGNQLWVVGGTSKKKNAKKTLFLVDTDELSVNHKNAADGPDPRCYASVVAIDDQLVLFGGELVEDGKCEDSLYVLNMGNEKWARYQDLANAPSGRTGHTTVVKGQTIYLWGGQKGDQYYQDFYTLCINTSPPKWGKVTAANPGPAARAGHVSVAAGNLIYIFGGADNKNIYNDVWTFDLETSVWTRISAKGYVPAPRERCSAALVDGIMYVFGGQGAEQRELGDLCAYKLSSQRWYKFQNMGKTPSARHGHTLTAVNDKIYVFGGEPNDEPLLVNVLDCAKIRYPQEASQETPSRLANSSSPKPAQQPDVYDTSARDVQVWQAMGDSRLSPPPERNTQSPILPSTTVAKPDLRLSIGDSQRSRWTESDTSIPQSPPPATASTPRTSHEDKAPLPAMATNMNQCISPQPGLAPGPRSPSAGRNHLSAEEHATLLRHIKARDTVIFEMKKKEQWWRTEVSLARRLRGMKGHPVEEGPEVDEARLMTFHDDNSQKRAIFESLVEAKAEIRQAKATIVKLEEPMRRLQTAALAEAAHYKAKCEAFEAQATDDLRKLDIERARDIKQRLTEALRENDSNSRILHQLQRRAQDDQKLRMSAEQRAQEAEKQIRHTQESHRRVLGELEATLNRLAEADTREREYAAKLADMSLQLSESLKRSSTNDEAAKVRIELSRLEIKHLDTLNEADMTKRQLEESMVDVARLRTLLNERDDELYKSNQRLEEVEVQLGLMKKSRGMYAEEAALTF